MLLPPIRRALAQTVRRYCRRRGAGSPMARPLGFDNQFAGKQRPINALNTRKRETSLCLRTPPLAPAIPKTQLTAYDGAVVRLRPKSLSRMPSPARDIAGRIPSGRQFQQARCRSRPAQSNQSRSLQASWCGHFARFLKRVRDGDEVMNRATVPLTSGMPTILGLRPFSQRN